MQITVNIPDRLAAQARARGVTVEVYVEEVLKQQTRQSAGEAPSNSVGEAIDRIMELRKGNKLQGANIKGLIHEGHKH
jgi:post-segregation antitoxin (ccd killing protein)